jgi:gluconate kinase
MVQWSRGQDDWPARRVVIVLMSVSGAGKTHVGRRLIGGGGEQLVHLAGPYELIRERVIARERPFMSPELLASQFETLDPPEDALVVDVSQPSEALVETIRTALGLRSEEEEGR